MEANGQLQQTVHVVREVQGREAQLEETVDDITTEEVHRSIASQELRLGIHPPQVCGVSGEMLKPGGEIRSSRNT